MGLGHLGTASGALCRGPSLRKLLEAGEDTLHVRVGLSLEQEDRQLHLALSSKGSHGVSSWSWARLRVQRCS